MELNIRIDLKKGNYFGHFNTKQREVEKFNRLMPIAEFCEYSLGINKVTEKQLEKWINEEDRDHDAVYGWTYEGSLICVNFKTKVAQIKFNQELYNLSAIVIDKNRAKNPPDFCFRG